MTLTDEGRRQAKELGRCLEGRNFVLVLTSPLRRAIETCRLAGFGEAAQMRDDLREWDYGDYEGRTTADIRSERVGWSLWTGGAPGGETAEEVGRRADRVMGEALASGGDVALFAHGHILRVLTARWLDLPPVRGRSFALDTATISILGYEREAPVISRWNMPCG